MLDSPLNVLVGGAWVHNVYCIDFTVPSFIYTAIYFPSVYVLCVCLDCQCCDLHKTAGERWRQVGKEEQWKTGNHHCEGLASVILCVCVCGVEGEGWGRRGQS